MPRTHLAVVFAGSGGAGAMTAGNIFLRAAAEAGYFGQMTQLFGPQIRGGESAALVQVSTRPAESPPDHFDLFVALDWEKVEQFAPEIPINAATVVLSDAAAGVPPAVIARSNARVISLPMRDAGTRLEQALEGIHSNTFAAGLVGALAGIDPEYLLGAVAKILGAKGQQVLKRNLAALEAGMNSSQELRLDLRIEKPTHAQRWLITGNHAIGLGLLRAGVKFVGCYPITPATDLVEWMAPELQRSGGQLLLAEDEIAAVNMVLGASFGGSPAATVTSGPGLSLMVETIGLAVASEIPLVVVDVMRVGPSTGIPSKTEQGDLNIAIYGAHGDAPRVVLAPHSVSDCLITAEWAVSVAESLQTPVIVLSDQMLGQARTIIDPNVRRPTSLPRRIDLSGTEAAFLRYKVGNDPVTAMPRPGTPNRQWIGEGLVHNEAGLPVSGAAPHAAQLAKRAKKLRNFDPGDLWGEVWGSGETAILTFGSCTAPAREAADRLQGMGRPIRVIALRQLAPLPMVPLGQALAGVKRILVLEQNYSGQFFRHLRSYGAVGQDCESIAKPGPLPFRPAEIVALAA